MASRGTSIGPKGVAQLIASHIEPSEICVLEVLLHASGLDEHYRAQTIPETCSRKTGALSRELLFATTLVLAGYIRENTRLPVNPTNPK
jgi:hypothetical protein